MFLIFQAKHKICCRPFVLKPCTFFWNDVLLYFLYQGSLVLWKMRLRRLNRCPVSGTGESLGRLTLERGFSSQNLVVSNIFWFLLPDLWGDDPNLTEAHIFQTWVGEKPPTRKGKEVVSQASFFRGKLAVSCGEGSTPPAWGYSRSPPGWPCLFRSGSL